MSAPNKSKLSSLAVFALCAISAAALLVLSSFQDADDTAGTADAEQEGKRDDDTKRIEKISSIEQDLARRTSVDDIDDAHDEAVSSRDEKISSYAHALTDKIAASAAEPS